jgi:hypothetical protein
MMTWSRSIIVNKKAVKTTTGTVETDAYRAIMGDEKAQVEMLIGTQVGFGDAKVHTVIRLTCNQDAKTLQTAGQLAYMTAKDLCMSALDDLAPPAAPPPPTPASPTYGVPR